MKIEELARLIHPRDGHEKIFAMIEAYLDESGIHAGAKVCVVGGYFGDLKSMKELGDSWEKTLQEFNFPMDKFHAKNMLGNPAHSEILSALALAIENQRSAHSISQSIVVDDFMWFSEEYRRWMTAERQRQAENGSMVDRHKNPTMFHFRHAFRG